jgi:hypothetical protein
MELPLLLLELLLLLLLQVHRVPERVAVGL